MQRLAEATLLSLYVAEVPFNRFGFTPPTVPPEHPKMPNQPDLCSRAVGDENWAGSSNAEYEHLPALLAHFLTAKSLDDVPRELIDLRQDHAKISAPWAFDVEEICINGHIFYVLSPSADPQAQPKVVLQNAATVLQIARVGWSDAREIARNLVARGMEFWLWDEIPAPPPDRPLQPPSSAAYNGLGLRPLDFKPTRADYEDYVERRNAFLRSPRGRAARFAGGIVGRLAREVDIDDDLPIPDETFENGVCVWDGESPIAYRDISITTHEMDLICGVYFLPTGQLNRREADGLEKKLISWWPTPAVFHHSGLNVGWWTPDCERWFQATLKEMEDPETPYSVGLRRDWKRKIRFQPLQGSRTVWIMSEKIADQYLTRRAQDGHNVHSQKERGGAPLVDGGSPS